MKTFSLARFYYDLRNKDISLKSIKASMSWANECHGMPAQDGFVTTRRALRYRCADEWLKEVVKND